MRPLLVALFAVCQDGHAQPAGPASPGPQLKLVAREVSVGKTQRNLLYETGVAMSPDRQRVAYLTHQNKGSSLLLTGGTYRTVIDGVAGPEFKTVRLPVFSPDGKRVAYWAGSGRDARYTKDVLVVDGKPWTERKVSLIRGPVFSADSRRVACVVGKSGQQSVLEEDREGKAFYEIKELEFSPDGKRLAYLAVTRKARSEWRSQAVIDGQEGPEYLDIKRLTFSADGSRVAYWAKRPAGGPEAKPGKQDGLWTAVVDGKAVPYLMSGPAAFSPDGKQVAYVGGSLEASPSPGIRLRAVVDGKAQYALEGLVGGGVRFSPDGRRLACVSTLRNGQEVATVDGQAGPAFGDVFGPHFSPDGRRVAYSGKTPSGEVMVVDGVPGREYAYVSVPHFSPDSRRIAYGARRRDRTEVMVVDGMEGQAYARVGQPAFSPDSKHVAYEASGGGSGTRVPSVTGFSEAVIVVDGVAGQVYPLILAQQGFVEHQPGGVAQITTNLPPGEGLALAFTGPTSLRFVAARSAGANNVELFRVDMEIVH